jgi:hypothetical protein
LARELSAFLFGSVADIDHLSIWLIQPNSLGEDANNSWITAHTEVIALWRVRPFSDKWPQNLSPLANAIAE